MMVGSVISDGNVTWKVVNDKASSPANGGGGTLPIGSVVPYLNNDDLPEGYLLCDGAEILKSEYGDLYNVIGDTYGEASDTLHFVLPDLRDKFIEGGITAGDDIEAGLPNITGTASIYDLSVPTSYFTANGYSGALTSNGLGTRYANSGGTSTYVSESVSLKLDASISSSIYSDNVDTVQPPSLTVRYIIKALGSGQTLIPADNTKLSVSYKDTFTIIYPNGGTEESPANVTTSSTYIENNPFPGYIVYCEPEIYYNGEWGHAPLEGHYDGNNHSCGNGIYGTQHNNDKIIIRTGSETIIGSGYIYDLRVNSWESSISGAQYSIPCRVKVWKVGKLDPDAPDLQEVSVHNTITVDEDQYLANSFTIIYPNGGTADSPANVSNNSDYIMDNPFPGYYITCQPEIYVNNEWGVSPYAEIGYDSTHLYGEGLCCFQHNDGNIILSTGSLRLIGISSYRHTVYPNTFLNNTQEIEIAPCRIKVWKVGKIPTT